MDINVSIKIILLHGEHSKILLHKRNNFGNGIRKSAMIAEIIALFGVI